MVIGDFIVIAKDIRVWRLEAGLSLTSDPTCCNNYYIDKVQTSLKKITPEGKYIKAINSSFELKKRFL